MIDEETYNYVDNIADNLKEIRQIHSLALPSDMLLFNIMRACVGIVDIKDLWFYEVRHHRF